MSVITYNVLPNPLWQFTDAAGIFLMDGTIETFLDTNRTTPKPVYQTPDDSTPWDNPLSLSSAGSVNGLFWADDADYWVVVRDLNGVQKYEFTVYSTTAQNGANSATLKNHILDGQFRFPYATSFPNIQANTFIAPKCIFNKTSASTDNASIIDFPLGQTFVNEGNPVSYLNIECTIPNVTETLKNIFFYFSDVTSFEMQPITIAFWAKSTTAAQIYLLWNQFFGAGGSTSVGTVVPGSTTTLTSTWTKYFYQFTPPSTTGKTKGGGFDDVAELAFIFPFTSVFNVQLTNVEVKLGDFPGVYDYRTYEQQRGVSFAQRLPFAITPADTNKSLIVGLENTGLSQEAAYVLNNNAGVINEWAGVNALPSDAILCNGATLDASANNNKYMNLYLSIMNQWGTGADGLFNMVSGDGLSAIAINDASGAIIDALDVNTGMTVTTTTPGTTGYFHNMFHWLAPLDFLGGGTRTSSNTVWLECLYVGAVTEAYDVNTGFTIINAIQGSADGKAVIGIQTTDGSVIGLSGSHFIIYDENGTMYAPWIKVDGSGAAPVVPGAILIEVDILSLSTAQDVAMSLALALGGNQVTKIDAVPGSDIIPGSYLLINGNSHEWYLYFTVDGAGADPAPAGKTRISPVAVLSTDTAEEVALKITVMLGAPLFKVPLLNNGQFVRGGPVINGSIDPDFASRAGGNTLGSLQPWQIQSHTHPLAFPPSGSYYSPEAGSIQVAGGPNPIAEGRTFPVATLGAGTNQTNPYNVYLRYIIRY